MLAAMQQCSELQTSEELTKEASHTKTDPEVVSGCFLFSKLE